MAKEDIEALSDLELEEYARRLRIIVARRERDNMERNLRNLRLLLAQDKARILANMGSGCKDNPGPREHGGDDYGGAGAGGMAN
jgi:hypothetical protein